MCAQLQTMCAQLQTNTDQYRLGAVSIPSHFSRNPPLTARTQRLLSTHPYFYPLFLLYDCANPSARSAALSAPAAGWPSRCCYDPGSCPCASLWQRTVWSCCRSAPPRRLPAARSLQSVRSARRAAAAGPWCRLGAVRSSLSWTDLKKEVPLLWRMRLKKTLKGKSRFELKKK